MTARGRRWSRVLLGVFVLGATVAIAAPSVVRVLLRRQLQTMIAEQLDARLEIGGLAYDMPYGVTVTDAVLIGTSPDGKPLHLLRLPRVELQLARLPFGGGPLVIESLQITDPAVHLIRDEGGTIFKVKLASTTHSAPTIQKAPQTAPPKAPPKLSEIFRLRHVGLHGGQIVYEDRAHKESVPLVWRNLNLNLETTPKSAGNYNYHLIVNNAPLAKLEATGSADIDELVLNIEKCAMAVNIDPKIRDESALPPEHQALLRDWNVQGTLLIDVTGIVPARNPGASIFAVSMELKPSSARVPGWETALDKLAFKIDLTDSAGGHPIAKIEHLEALAGDASFRLDNVIAIADVAAMKWNLQELRGRVDPGRTRTSLPQSIRKPIDDLQFQGALDFALSGTGPLQAKDLKGFTGLLQLTPRDISLRPLGFEDPVADLTPIDVHLVDGAITIDSLRAKCGTNLLFLKHAALKLDGLPTRLRLTGLEGCATFGPEQRFPKPLADLLAMSKPVGPFFFGGSVDLDLSTLQHRLDYNIEVHTRRGMMSLTDRHIPVSGIDASVSVTPSTAIINRFEATTLGGVAIVNGRVDLTGQPAYHLNTTLRNIDLKELSGYLTEPGQPPLPLSGRAVVTARLNGITPKDGQPAYQGLAGTGEFEILGGDFWRIPMMKFIADHVSVDGSLTVGEAAGKFQLGNNKVHFDRAIVTSPALGVEVNGDVAFDGRLDLKGIAKGFGQWGDRVGDVGDGGGIARIASAVQNGLDTATRQAFYEVNVTGTLGKPTGSVTFAKAVTGPIKRLLGQSMDETHKGKLLDVLNRDANSHEPPVK